MVFYLTKTARNSLFWVTSRGQTGSDDVEVPPAQDNRESRGLGFGSGKSGMVMIGRRDWWLDNCLGALVVVLTFGCVVKLPIVCGDCLVGVGR